MVATVQPSIPVDTIPIPEQPDSDSYSPGSSFPTETQEEYRRRNNIDLSGVLPLAVTGATVVGLGTLVVSTLPREGDHYEGYVDEGSLEWRSQRAFYTAGALTGSGIVASLAQSAYKGQADYVDGPLDVVQTVSYIGGSSFLAAGAFMAEAEDPTSRDGLGGWGGCFICCGKNLSSCKGAYSKSSE